MPLSAGIENSLCVRLCRVPFANMVNIVYVLGVRGEPYVFKAAFSENSIRTIKNVIK